MPGSQKRRGTDMIVSRLKRLSPALAATCLMLSLLAFSRPAAAQWVVTCTNCSTITNQLLQYAKEAESALTEAQQLDQQMNMYKNMVTQGTLLSNLQWGTLSQDISNLNSLVSRGTSISYATSNLESKFTSSFPGYSSFLSSTPNASQTQADLAAWSSQTNSAVSNSLMASQQQMNDVDQENGTMTTIQQHSSSAIGQMQAIQAGNEMSTQIVQQLQKLRQLIATEMTLQAQAIAAQQRTQDADKAAWNNTHVDPTTITIDTTVPTAGPAGLGTD
jgi:P-type conjugative transfer protein TrbJ